MRKLCILLLMVSFLGACQWLTRWGLPLIDTPYNKLIHNDFEVQVTGFTTGGAGTVYYLRGTIKNLSNNSAEFDYYVIEVIDIDTGKKYTGSSFRLVEGRVENPGELYLHQPIIPPNSTVDGIIGFTTLIGDHIGFGGASANGLDVYYGESRIEVRTKYYKSKK